MVGAAYRMRCPQVRYRHQAKLGQWLGPATNCGEIAITAAVTAWHAGLWCPELHPEL
jgi:hypothetical protein